ncbi:hypothetical protein [Psychroserpens luteus]|uniref:Lipoprotein n=1 Tax=Psychroserpens luteus TaxID=1434066 RepID=A0ABW5ZVX5_9FLAO|nr:hypothetical protein [Psychroserpens luteus]
MKIYLKMLIVLVVLMSCQDTKKEGNGLISKVEKEEISQKRKMDASKDKQNKQILTKAQFEDFFPKDIVAYKLFNVSVLMSSAFASAMYVKGNDYDHTLTYSLEDCNRKGAANVKNFEASYKIKGQGAPGTEYIYKERDGHKTIAFLQPKINRNDLRFVYNNRFRIVIKGAETIETLWSYIKKEDLQKLDTY